MTIQMIKKSKSLFTDKNNEIGKPLDNLNKRQKMSKETKQERNTKT